MPEPVRDRPLSGLRKAPDEAKEESHQCNAFETSVITKKERVPIDPAKNDVVCSALKCRALMEWR